MPWGGNETTRKSDKRRIEPLRAPEPRGWIPVAHKGLLTLLLLSLRGAYAPSL
jgi:hypothetical protein